MRDSITDAMGEDGQTLDDAIGTLSPETRFDIVAGQLDPEPKVEINGSDIRLVFDGGSIEQAFMDCIIAGVVLEEGETLTLVFPDGEEAC